jgi:FkbM family methyltransferase
VLTEAEQVRKGFELLCDDRSRKEFVSQVRFRLLADFDGLAHPDSDPQYLAPDLFLWRDDEVFVDGGAFDGDTLRSVLTAGKSFERYIALEPDAMNFHALERYAETLPASVRPRVELSPLAAYSTRMRMRLDAAGSASAVLVEATGDVREDDVECIPLDQYLAERTITFVKLDIEGAEPNALLGARRVIARDRPVLAVCVYHSQNHLWRLPLLIDSIVKDYCYYLRPYNEEAWDLVCYAVPIERALHERTRN